MFLNTLWFVLIAILYIGYFVLEGFDFGVGILLPLLGKNDAERRMIINTIGPHWDGNEVWLITAGGATFAAFPEWYATLFSAFYLPFFLLLVGLILRGVAFEFRSKDENPRWRTTWDWCIFVGSLIPALLLGVAFANIVHGIPINANMQYTGGFFNLLNPYALLAGVATVLVFTLHGAIFLTMKTAGDVLKRAQAVASKLWLPIVVVMLAFLVATYFATDILTSLGVDPGIVPLVGIVALLAAGYFLRKQNHGWAFSMTCITIAFALVTMFLILYPRVLISNLDPAWSLTIENAASSAYTLRVMTIVALIFIPVVLIYQGWSYWVFRKRVSEKPQELTY
jgi:cytochrome d ubiquinol oxidase subunit II